MSNVVSLIGLEEPQPDWFSDFLLGCTMTFPGQWSVPHNGGDLRASVIDAIGVKSTQNEGQADNFIDKGENNADAYGDRKWLLLGLVKIYLHFMAHVMTHQWTFGSISVLLWIEQSAQSNGAFKFKVSKRISRENYLLCHQIQTMHVFIDLCGFCMSWASKFIFCILFPLLRLLCPILWYFLMNMTLWSTQGSSCFTCFRIIVQKHERRHTCWVHCGEPCSRWGVLQFLARLNIPVWNMKCVTSWNIAWKFLLRKVQQLEQLSWSVCLTLVAASLPDKNIPCFCQDWQLNLM